MAFQRTPLAVAVCTAVLCAPVGAASLLDNAAPAVNLYSAGAGFQLRDFDVAGLPNGRFAVLWTEGDDSGEDDLKLARFDADGNTVGDVLELAEDPGSSSIGLRDPALATDADGDLVAVWSLTVSDDCGALRFARVASDNTVTPARSVTGNGGAQCRGAVAMNAGGQFVVGWYDDDPDASSQHRVQAFNADGTAIGPDFAVGHALYDDAPALALQGDTFLAAWTDKVVNDQLILGRRYNLNGTALGDADFRLDDGTEAGTSLYQTLPALAADQDGGFLGVWAQEVWVDHEPVYSQLGRHRAADGTAGAALAVHSGDLRTGGPSVATDGAGLVAVAWSMALPEDQGAQSQLALFQDGQPLGDGPVTVAASNPESVDYSDNTKVVIGGGTAAVVWYEQDDGGHSMLRARSLSLTDGAPGDGGGGDSGGSGGGGGGGGTTGLLTLLGLGLLARRRHR